MLWTVVDLYDVVRTDVYIAEGENNTAECDRRFSTDPYYYLSPDGFYL